MYNPSILTIDGLNAEAYEYPDNRVLILESLEDYDNYEPKKLIVSKEYYTKIINENGNFKTR